MKRDDVNLGKTRRPLGDGPQAFCKAVVLSAELGRRDNPVTWGQDLLSEWDQITLMQQREKAARCVVALPPEYADPGYYDETAAYLNEQARWDRENESWER